MNNKIYYTYKNYFFNNKKLDLIIIRLFNKI